MQETREHLPVEDMVLKTAAQYFADELFPYLGIREKAARLLKENRDSDLLRSLEDPEFQEQLFKEYQL